MLAAESPFSPNPAEGALNGLGDGEGREDFATSDGTDPIPFVAPPGENRDGTVPARALRACGILSGVGSCM